MTALDQLLSIDEPRGGYVHLNQLRVYPAVLTFYAAGITAVTRGNFALMRKFHALRAQDSSRGEQVSALTVLSPSYVLQGQIPAVVNGRRLRTPSSDRVFEVVKSSLLQTPMMNEKRYVEMFTRFEYLNALAAHLAPDVYPFYRSTAASSCRTSTWSGGAAHQRRSVLN